MVAVAEEDYVCFVTLEGVNGSCAIADVFFESLENALATFLQFVGLFLVERENGDGPFLILVWFCSCKFAEF